MNWKVFFTRTLSAIVFAIVMLFGLISPDPFIIVILALLVQFIGIREYFHLMTRIFTDAYFPRWHEYIFQILGVIVVSVIAFKDVTFLLPLILILFILFLSSVLSKHNSFYSFISGLSALFYISVPLAFLVVLRQTHIAIPLAIVFMIWCNDTMAYIVGSFIGKTPFSPISPKKTWEGTAGGAILTIIGALIWAYFSKIDGFYLYDWLVIALIAVTAGTAGDLLESKLKRMAQVKDSGNIMPGHGGILDRFDSLLIALPFVFCYAYFFLNLAK